MQARLSALPGVPDDRTAMFAHDLKSPLSTITMNLDFAIDVLEASAPSPDIREALFDCRAEAVRMRRMIDNLVAVARAHRGELQLHEENADACELLRLVERRCRDDAASRGVRLEVDASSIPMFADVTLWERALVALVESALRASRPGASVRVRAEKAGAELILRVAFDAPLAAVVADALAWELARAVTEAHGGGAETSAGEIAMTFPRGLS